MFHYISLFWGQVFDHIFGQDWVWGEGNNNQCSVQCHPAKGKNDKQPTVTKRQTHIKRTPFSLCELESAKPLAAEPPPKKKANPNI